MTAVWLRVRAELRSRLHAAIALALVIGLGGGVVLASAAGARRTDSAYGRFLDGTNAADVFLASGTGAKGDVLPVIDFDAVRRFPTVERLVEVRAPFGTLVTRGGAELSPEGLNIQGPPTRKLWDQGLLGAKLLAGQLPNPGRPDEIAVGYRHWDPRVHIGAHLGIALIRRGITSGQAFSGAFGPQDRLPPVDVTITGIVLMQGELAGSSDALVTPAFLQTYSPRAFGLPGAAAWLNGGLADLPAFSRSLSAIAPGAFFGSARDEAVLVNRSTHLLALSLWLFAALATLAGILIFGQALARQIFGESTENPTLRALGMSTGQVFGVAMVRAGLIGVVAVVAAGTTAFVLSPLTPFGHLARLAEPDPGFAFDTVVIGGGAILLMLVVVGMAAIPAFLTARVRGDATGAAEMARARPSALAGAFARRGLWPTAVAGVRLALEPGRGRTAVPVRTTLVGVALTIAALATSLSFMASFDHLTHTPRLYGVFWDIDMGNPFGGPEVARRLEPILEADPNLETIAGANIFEFVQVGRGPSSVRVNVWAFESLRGSSHPTVAVGRWPRAPDEIALGAKTLRVIGGRVGDTVEVKAGPRTASLRIVGRAVFPPGGFGPGLAEGAGMTVDGLQRLIPNAIVNAFAVTVKPGVDTRAEIRKLNARDPQAAAERASIGGEIANLRRIRGLPLVLSGLLALAAAGTLAHTLVTAIRRRRRDLAILKTLGFVRRQVSMTVAWQASTLAIVALVIGVPLGVAAGRWAWRVFADQLGVIPEPVTPIALALLLIPATILLANLVAAVPARIASRLRPAQVLRTE